MEAEGSRGPTGLLAAEASVGGPAAAPSIPGAMQGEADEAESVVASPAVVAHPVEAVTAEAEDQSGDAGDNAESTPLLGAEAAVEEEDDDGEEAEKSLPAEGIPEAVLRETGLSRKVRGGAVGVGLRGIHTEAPRSVQEEVEVWPMPTREPEGFSAQLPSSQEDVAEQICDSGVIRVFTCTWNLAGQVRGRRAAGPPTTHHSPRRCPSRQSRSCFQPIGTISTQSRPRNAARPQPVAWSTRTSDPGRSAAWGRGVAARRRGAKARSHSHCSPAGAAARGVGPSVCVGACTRTGGHPPGSVRPRGHAALHTRHSVSCRGSWCRQPRGEQR